MKWTHLSVLLERSKWAGAASGSHGTEHGVAQIFDGILVDFLFPT